MFPYSGRLFPADGRANRETYPTMKQGGITQKFKQWLKGDKEPDYFQSQSYINNHRNYDPFDEWKKENPGFHNICPHATNTELPNPWSSRSSDCGSYEWIESEEQAACCNGSPMPDQAFFNNYHSYDTQASVGTETNKRGHGGGGYQAIVYAVNQGASHSCNQHNHQPYPTQDAPTANMVPYNQSTAVNHATLDSTAIVQRPPSTGNHYGGLHEELLKNGIIEYNGITARVVTTLPKFSSRPSFRRRPMVTQAGEQQTRDNVAVMPHTSNDMHGNSPPLHQAQARISAERMHMLNAAATVDPELAEWGCNNPPSANSSPPETANLSDDNVYLENLQRQMAERVAYLQQIAREAAAAITNTVEQQDNSQQAQQDCNAVPDNAIVVPEDTTLLALQEGPIACQPCMQTVRILPTISAHPSELGYRKSATENGAVTDIANKPNLGGTGGSPPSAPQLLRPAFVAWPRSRSTPNGGDDGHTPGPYAGLLRARHRTSVAQSACDSPLTFYKVVSCDGTSVDEDDYLTMKEDRDELANKLLATNEQLAKEQLLRRAAESNVVSQRNLVEQLVSAQDGLQPPPDLDAVPLGTLCSAVGNRLLSVATAGLTYAVGTTLTFAAKAMDVVEGLMAKQLSWTVTTVTDQKRVATDTDVEPYIIHRLYRFVTPATQHVLWCLQALPTCMLPIKAAAVTVGHVLSNRSKQLSHAVTMWLYTVLGMAVLLTGCSAPLLRPPFLTRIYNRRATQAANSHMAASSLQAGTQLCITHSDQQEQELARAGTAPHDDMAACLPDEIDEVSSRVCSLYMRQADMTVGRNATGRCCSSHTRWTYEDAFAMSRVVQEDSIPDNTAHTYRSQSKENVSMAVSEQSAVVGQVWQSIYLNAPNVAQAAGTPSHELATSLAPSGSGNTYRRFVARTRRFLKSLPKPPSFLDQL